MDKGTVLDRLGLTGEDRLVLAKVLDRAEQAANRNIPAATDFLSPQQQMQALDLLRLAGIAEPEAGHVLLEKIAGRLDEEELLGLIRLYRGKVDTMLAPRVQLSYGEDETAREIADGAFLI